MKPGKIERQSVNETRCTLTISSGPISEHCVNVYEQIDEIKKSGPDKNGDWYVDNRFQSATFYSKTNTRDKRVSLMESRSR